MNVLTALDNGEVATGLFVDLSKAFDTVNHEKLLEKMYAYGIRGNIYELFKSYLKDRKQIIAIKSKNRETYSDPTTINVGIPQGSILGPILYILYTNDLPNVTDDPMSMYADDTNLNINSDSAEECAANIINNTQALNEYFGANDLSMNLEKNKIVHFKLNNSAKSMLTRDKIITESNVTISENANILGLTVDSNLNFSDHIENLCKKLSRASYALYLVRKHCNIEAAKIAYFGYFQSNMNYALLFWGSAPDCYINRVFILQKRALRGMCQLPPYTPCKQHFVDNKILTLPCLYIMELLMFVRKNPNRFASNKSKSNINTRNQNKLSIPTHTTSKFEKSPYYMCITAHNKLPPNLVNEPSHNIFRNIIKKTLIEKAYYSVQEFLNDTKVFSQK